MADIKDTEIRIIGDDKSFDSTRPLQGQKVTKKEEDNVSKFNIPEGRLVKNHRSYGCLKPLIVILLLIVILCLILLFIRINRSNSHVRLGNSHNDLGNYPSILMESTDIESRFEDFSTQNINHIDSVLSDNSGTENSYCEIIEETINGIPIRVFLPINLLPDLFVGKIDQNDNSILLALQAADIRKDNGMIVGACVDNGEIISKGIAKQGYVAIIENKISIGVSEHSPLFEDAVEKSGDFFRQYPLVVNGEIFDNRPKNVSIRRAICERNGKICIVETLQPVSFHDFSQILVDYHVNNAVYLVGSKYACGFYRDENQSLKSWGDPKFSNEKNISYLIWRRQN